MPLFLFIFHIFITYIHSFNHIHTIHKSVAIRRGLSPSPHRLKAQWEKTPTIRRGLSPSPHRLKAQWEKTPCGAEPRIELRPAVQQADVLPTEPRRTEHA